MEELSETDKAFIKTCLGMTPENFVDYVLNKAGPRHMILIEKVMKQVPVEYLQNVREYLNNHRELIDKWYERRQKPSGLEDKSQ